MDKKTAAAQLKLANELFRDGESMLKSNPAKGEEKIQEALAISVKVVEAAPNIIEGYQLVSQIFLRRGDRKSFLHYQKGYQFLKSGGRFPEPSELPEFEYVAEIREEVKAKPAKKKELQKESTLFYPPKLIPFPKPVPRLVSGESAMRVLPIPSGVKNVAQETAPLAVITPSLKEAGGAIAVEHEMFKFDLFPITPETSVDLALARFELRGLPIAADTFSMPARYRIPVPAPAAENLSRLLAVCLRALWKQPIVASVIPVSTRDIRKASPAAAIFSRRPAIASMHSKTAAAPAPAASRVKMNVRTLRLPPDEIRAGAIRPDAMRPVVVPPRTLEIPSRRIREYPPPLVCVQGPMALVFEPGCAAPLSLPRLPRIAPKIAPRVLVFNIFHRAPSAPPTFESQPMPAWEAPVSRPRRLSIPPALMVRSLADRIAAPRREKSAPFSVSIPSFRQFVLRISPDGKRSIPPVFKGKVGGDVRVSRHLSVRVRFLPKDRMTPPDLYSRTRSATPRIALPSFLRYGPAAPAPVRKSTVHAKPRLDDHPKKTVKEIPLSAPSPVNARGFLAGATVGGTVDPPTVAARSAEAKGAGAPIILSIAPKLAKKAPIRMQAYPQLMLRDMKYLEEPEGGLVKGSIIDRIDAGEHPLLAFALEMEQEGERLSMADSKDDAIEAFTEGANALIEAGEVQGAAEMFVKALKCSPGSSDILKRLDRLQIQGAKLKPEIQLEIRRKVYGLK